MTTAATRQFTKILVANRGEIACRIIGTLQRLGIRSVAICHALDHRARHARMADEVHAITGETPVAAHLDIAQIVEIARRSGAEAIHPGYGFLSENADFAAAVADAGLVFIGPDAETIRLMGDKITSRRFAETHGVPVAPSAVPTDDLDAFLGDAAAIGFPLLIKAAAGGGGKGMSIVDDRSELADKAALAASEAKRYFADSRIYAERYIAEPRHIEVQVFGDGAGNAVHLIERECSVQRRFQKIIEEAPAVGLSEKLRREIWDAAVRLARAARYRNAGTVEFILAPDGAFYFLEMNTRLQVEHPVTEMVTGLDLVELQLAVAGGASLPSQDDIRTSGHAIECRICAEDPDRDFLPETGRVLRLAEPSTNLARFDSGLVAGQTVSASFDPMLAKLIVHGGTRDEAIARAGEALRETAILGVVTNLDYLARIVGHPAFRDGALHTGFLTEHAAALATPPADDEARTAALLVAFVSSPELRRQVFDVPEPYAAMGGWRN
ncbi:acetyl-CoA carboxylase biotin carboxylase subunit [Oceanibacterium hippocampi]|uniref:Acetyl-/propionyl-coenzyme A carboxylase alpha chain n=1 Tax=Oceanibacterium hippocampi TaxID=745714 RepID=A0A1Y5SRX6_9PROT|nr:biotin carboxylase N-terminal domain-containing protein [Oceanibacterium hippocampi]SLN46604.1 Acetyl-/propionyl-coenzyme A carboxylase alpha chain [Oceanibacterium hippocampi]